MNPTVGVTNPYAIAEQIAGKSIQWSSLADPVSTLTQILNLPEKQIFAVDSPLLRPGVQADAQGNILKRLSAEESQTRLNAFLKQTLPAQPLRLQRLQTLQLDSARLLTDLALPTETQSGNSQPWQPANTAWADVGDFFEDLGEINDPIQGALANCYFISAMSSVAWSRPYAIANVVRPSVYGDDNAPVHRVTFYRDGLGNGESVEVSELLPVVQGSLAWRYARSKDAGETWPAILEKAFAKWKTSNTTDFPDYGPLAYGDPVLATAQIVRGNRNYRAHKDLTTDQMVQAVRGNSLGKRTFNPMTAWTYGASPAGLDYNAARVVANHAYSILGWEFVNNQYYIVLRNPWGTHEAQVDVLPGNWSSVQQFNANMPLNTDGVFAMKAATFKQYFAGFGWVV